MDWISVEEQLPQLVDEIYSEDVLTWCISHGKPNEWGCPNTYAAEESYMAIDRITKWNDASPSFRTSRFFGKVTHWMPLPKPPKDLKNDN